MKQLFIETQEIISVNQKIQNLYKQIENTKTELFAVTESEIEKQFKLIKGKTIIRFRQKEYIYSGYYGEFDWIWGNKITNTGTMSKKRERLYDEWIKK